MYKEQYNVLNKLNKLFNEKFGTLDIKVQHDDLLINVDIFINKKKIICEKLMTAVQMFDISFNSFYKIENVVNKFICELNMLHNQYDDETSKYNELKNEKEEMNKNNIKEYWGMMIFSKDVVFDRNLFEKVVRYELITRENDIMIDNINNIKNKIEDVTLRLKFYAEIKHVVFTNKKIKKKIELLILELNNLNINQNKNIDNCIDVLCDDLQQMIKISIDDNIKKMTKLCDNFEGIELFCNSKYELK